MSITLTRGIFDWAPDELKPVRPLLDTTQVLRVDSVVIDQWADGGPKITIKTVVDRGEHEGLTGPQLTLSVGATAFRAKDGKERRIDQAASEKTLSAALYMVTNGAGVKLHRPNVLDAETLQELADGLTGHTFVARIGENEKGFYTIDKRWSMDMAVEESVIEATSSKYRFA